MLSLGLNIWRPVLRNAKPASPNASSRTILFEGDSITAAAQSYAYQYEGYASPQYTSYSVAAVAGSTIFYLNQRAAANDAKITLPGSNIYVVMIGRNDLSADTTGWLTSMAAHCDARRAAGWLVAIISILPSTSVGFNGGRATANAEMALWETNGSTIAGKHCDKFISLDATLMGTDSTASNTTYYSDGTHPTIAGQTLLEASLRPIINSLTQTNVVAAPQPSVASGTYATTQTVTLTSATAGAAIYYTLDSSDPTTLSTLYTGAFTVTASQTIRAVSAKAGMVNSAINEGIYTFGSAPATTNGQAWYKFNAGINNATGGVARWEDRWFGRHVSQSTTSRRPANASGIISFDGNDALQKVFTLEQPCTVYALLRQDVWSNVAVVIGGAAADGGLYQYSSSPNLCAYASAFGPQATQATIGSFVAVCMVLDGASSSVRVNNNAAVVGNANTSGMGGITLAATKSFSQGSRVSFKEVVVYNVAHNSTSQDTEITRLLAL